MNNYKKISLLVLSTLVVVFACSCPAENKVEASTTKKGCNFPIESSMDRSITISCAGVGSKYCTVCGKHNDGSADQTYCITFEQLACQ